MKAENLPMPSPASRLRRAPVVVLLGLAAACSGALGHRSVAELASDLPIGPAVRRIRIVVPDGPIGIDHGDARTVQIRGGVRRAADSAEDLAALERIPLAFTAATDPEDPSLLVVRAPERGPSDPIGVFAFELGIRVPAELPLEVQIAGNSSVVIANRRAPTAVTLGRGDLRFENCHGGIDARTGRGQVLAFGCRGDVDLHTKVGHMQAWIDEPGRQLRLVTGQGTIQCFVPAELGFELDARAETGEVHASAFGLEEERVGRFGAVMTGQRGDGHTRIVLRTGSGHLSLSPPKAARDS